MTATGRGYIRETLDRLQQYASSLHSDIDTLEEALGPVLRQHVIKEEDVEAASEPAALPQAPCAVSEQIQIIFTEISNIKQHVQDILDRILI